MGLNVLRVVEAFPDRFRVVGLAAGSPAAIDPARVFPAYLAAVDRLTAYIDREWDSLR